MTKLEWAEGQYGFGKEVLETVDLIRPLLAGRPAVLQSAVLAELLGLLLAGHWIPDNPELTDELRKEVLKRHCDLAWELMQSSAHIIGTDK